MLNIFAALKVLIAKTGSSLGSVATLVIRENFIPRLEKELAGETNPDQQEKIREVLVRWKTYKETRWESIARGVVEYTASKWTLVPNGPTLGLSFADDLEQEVAYRLLEERRTRDVFDRFNPMDGPKKFASYWNGMLRYRASNAARDFLTHEPERHFGERSDIPVEKIPTQGEHADSDEDFLQGLRKDLDRYVATKFSGDETALMVYKAWMDKADQIGAEGVIFSRHVLRRVEESLKKKGLSSGKSTINNAWIRVQKVIKDYIRNEHERPIAASHLNLVERVAHAEYRCRLADWVLGRRTDNPLIFAP